MPIRNDHRPWTDAERAAVVEMARAGVKYATIGRRVGRSPSAVGKVALALAGRRWRALADPGPAIRRLHAAGADDGDIASELGCTPAAVCYWRRKLGLPASPRPKKGGG